LNDNFKQNIDKSLSACDAIKSTKTTKTAMLYYTSTPFEMDEPHLHSPRGDYPPNVTTPKVYKNPHPQSSSKSVSSKALKRERYCGGTTVFYH
jgi:hypothetical protein